MAIALQLKQFSGPLDLLLDLLQNKKLSINELALSEVTEQYLLYLDQMDDEHVHELADFLVVATRLLFLKSQQLLPQFDPEEEDGPSLEEQLRRYKVFVSASKQVQDRWLAPRRSVFRIEPSHTSHIFLPPGNVTLEMLRMGMVQLLSRIEPPKALPHTQIDKSISIKEKIIIIRKLLEKRKRMSFKELLSDAQNKTEVIIGFLALLELVKGRVVGLQQSDTFGDIVVERV